MCCMSEEAAWSLALRTHAGAPARSQRHACIYSARAQSSCAQTGQRRYLFRPGTGARLCVAAQSRAAATVGLAIGPSQRRCVRRQSPRPSSTLSHHSKQLLLSFFLFPPSLRRAGGALSSELAPHDPLSKHSGCIKAVKSGINLPQIWFCVLKTGMKLNFCLPNASCRIPLSDLSYHSEERRSTSCKRHGTCALTAQHRVRWCHALKCSARPPQWHSSR